MKDESLIGLQPLEELIRVIIATSFLKDRKPISAILVADSGAGKSKTLLRFVNEDGPYSETIQRQDDMTSAGLFDTLANDRDEKLRFIVIPDFNAPLSHKPTVVQLTIASLLNATEDGFVKVADGRTEKKIVHRPIGILTAATTRMFMQHVNRFANIGLTRRIIPLHYGYSSQTIDKAQKAITSLKFSGGQLKPLYLPAHLTNRDGSMKDLPKIPKYIAEAIEETSKLMASYCAQYRTQEGKIGQGISGYPMPYNNVLQTVCMGSALLHARPVATKSDLITVKKLVDFTNMMTKVTL
jgi:hypothetical protein